MITKEMIDKMTRVRLKLPNGIVEEFDVVWEDGTGRLVHDFYGWELHVNLNRLLEMSDTQILFWE